MSNKNKGFVALYVVIAVVLVLLVLVSVSNMTGNSFFGLFRIKEKAGASARAGCTDSDGGKNIQVKGNTVDKNGTNFTDTCVNSGYVLEGYCLKNYVSKESMICPLGYSCYDGACKVTQIDKTNETNHTACVNYKCLVVAGPGINECSNDADCDSVNQTNCTDSDGGKNILVQGLTKDRFREYLDICLTNSSVSEGFCLNDSVTIENMSCYVGYYCLNGACSMNSSNKTLLA